MLYGRKWELRTQHVFYSFEPLDSQKPSGSDIGKDLSRRLFDTVFVSTDKDRVFRLNEGVQRPRHVVVITGFEIGENLFIGGIFAFTLKFPGDGRLALVSSEAVT